MCKNSLIYEKFGRDKDAQALASSLSNIYEYSKINGNVLVLGLSSYWQWCNAVQGTLVQTKGPRPKGGLQILLETHFSGILLKFT